MAVFLTALAAAVVVGGSAYPEAETRALAYDLNEAGNTYDKTLLYPTLAQTDELTPCLKSLHMKMSKDTPGFKVVMGFKNFEFATVYIDKETPLSRCFAEAIAREKLPRAPIADYAERMTIVFQ